MRLVIIESPFSAPTEEERTRNVNYARAAMKDCLMRDEAPFASHLLYTQPGILRDHIAEERKQGIHAGLLWGNRADMTVVYSDLGISEGMDQGILAAARVRRPVQKRSLLDPGPGQDYCCSCWAPLAGKTSYGAGSGSETGAHGFFKCRSCHKGET